MNKNYNFSASYPSEVTFKTDITPTDYVAGQTNILVGSDSSNQSSGGGSNISGTPQVLQTGFKYVFRVSNNAGKDIKLGFKIDWYEI